MSEINCLKPLEAQAANTTDKASLNQSLSARVNHDMLAETNKGYRPGVNVDNTTQLDFGSSPYQPEANTGQHTGTADSSRSPSKEATDFQKFVAEGEMEAAEKLIERVPDLVEERALAGANTATIMGISHLDKQSADPPPPLTPPEQLVFDALKQEGLNPTIEKQRFKTSPDAPSDFGWVIQANWGA